MTTINVAELYGEQARLPLLNTYLAKATQLAGQGNDVTLTVPGPVWLYLAVAHALHGIAKSLVYDSPVTGPVTIFDHNPHYKEGIAWTKQKRSLLTKPKEVFS